MAEDRVASAGSLSHDNESDREGCRTKEPLDPQATPRRTSRRNLYMRRRRHRDASRHKLALRTRSSLHHSSEDDSQGLRSIHGFLLDWIPTCLSRSTPCSEHCTWAPWAELNWCEGQQRYWIVFKIIKPNNDVRKLKMAPNNAKYSSTFCNLLEQ